MVKANTLNKSGMNSKKRSTVYRRENRRKEYRLKLPLSATVKGKLPSNEYFEEQTKILDISARGASFGLNSSIIIGTKITLYIHLPDELNPNTKSKLKLGGYTIRLSASKEKDKKQFVAIRFYKIFNYVSL
ncbi:MAG: PilZ domain-containing protein [Elusimicrobiota bacterium]